MESPVKEKLIAVAHNVRDQRILKKYTQKYVADCLGLSLNGYARIERGFSKMNIEMIFKIAAVLDKPVKELLTVPR